jgi:hypothetical protein
MNEANPVETGQTLIGSDPKITVGGLRDGSHRDEGRSRVGIPRGKSIFLGELIFGNLSVHA